MAFITTTANSISSGGTINGSITIEGDLTVNGDGAGAYDEIIDGNLRISSTNKLEFGDTGTYIHQSADGVLDLVSDTEIEINATTIDVNGSMEVSGTITASDDLVVSDELRPYEIRSPGTGGIRLTNSQGGLVGSLGPRSSSNYGSGLKLEDDIGSVIFGTDSDYSAKYDSGSDALEIIEGITSASETVLFSLSSSTTEVNTATTNFNGTAINFESSSADSPILTIKNTNAGDGSPRLYFNHASASPEDNDELGQIRWYGLNDAGTPVSDTYARIKVNQTDVSSGSEAGKMSFQLMKAGTETDILILDGGNVGIGIAPASGTGQLHIDGGSNPSRMQFTNSATGQTSSDGMALGLDPDNNRFYFWNYDQTNTEFAVGGEVRFKIDGNSKISLSNNDLGASNTVFGKSAGNIDSNSNYNTFFGENVSDASMNGATSNTAIGYSSASGLTSGDNNVMVGSTAGQSATTSSKSVYIGAEAGEGANHNHNTYIGYQAGKVSGNSDNTAVGYLALGSGSNGYSNVAIGREALKNTTGHMAVAVGEGAMQENTSGQYNVAVGWSALRTNVDGDKNTAVGYKSLYTFEADTDGHGLNSALGWESGMDLTTGTENTLVGSNAGGNLTDGDQNTALGSYSLAQTIAGSSNNTALGFYACGAGDITHGGITAVGAYALAENIAGQKNVGVGFQAGNVLTTGSQNTIIGYDADADDDSATNQTVIGSEVTGVADNSVTLGNASVTAVYMAQDSGAMVHSGGLTTSGAVLTQGMSDNTDRFVVTDDGSSYKGGFTKKSGSMGGLFVRGSSSKIGILTNSSYAANPSGDTEAFMVSSADASATFGGNIIMADDTSIGISDSAERIEFDGAGDISVLGANLGVGNSAPDTLVLVGNNATNTDNGIKISANGTGHPYLQFANSDSATNHISKAMIFQDTTNSWYQGNLVIAIDETGDTSTVAAADEVIRIGAGSTIFSNIVDITNTTDASDDSGDTGALRVEGGASIAKKLYVGTDLDVDGTANLDVVDIDGEATFSDNIQLYNSSEKAGRIDCGNSGFTTLASSGTVTISSSRAGGAVICAYELTSGSGGVFAGSYGTTMAKVNASSDSSVADSGTDPICLYKSSGSSTITLKNRSASDRSIFIMVLGASVY